MEQGRIENINEKRLGTVFYRHTLLSSTCVTTLNFTDDNLSVPSPGMLEIKKATLEDAGEYICTVRNENGSVTKSFKVYVVEGVYALCVLCTCDNHNVIYVCCDFLNEIHAHCLFL